MTSKQKLLRKLEEKRASEERYQAMLRTAQQQLDKPFNELPPVQQEFLKNHYISKAKTTLKKYLSNIEAVKFLPDTKINNDIIAVNIDDIKLLFKEINENSGGILKNYLTELKEKQLMGALNLFKRKKTNVVMELHFYGIGKLNEVFEFTKLNDGFLVRRYSLNDYKKQFESFVDDIQLAPNTFSFLEEILINGKMVFNIDKYIEENLSNDINSISFEFGKKRK